MDYYISKNYCEQGPYTEEHLKDLLLRGELKGEWYARPTDGTEWFPLSEISVSLQPTDSETSQDTSAHSCPCDKCECATPTFHPLTGFPTAVTVFATFTILFSVIYFTSSANLDYIQEPYISLFIGTFFILMNWCYRIAQNANIIASKNETITSSCTPFVKPGAFVWSFFIPLYNLVAPYLTMQRIYCISLCPSAQKPKRFSLLVLLWWLSNLVLSYQIYTFETPTGYAPTQWLEGIAQFPSLFYQTFECGKAIFLTTIIQQIFLCLLVRKITHVQRARQQALTV